MSKLTPNIKAQDVKGLKEFVEEIVQKELELKVEEIVKNYLEKEDIDVENLKKCINKIDAKIIM